jgi:hypothetical protein
VWFLGTIAGSEQPMRISIWAKPKKSHAFNRLFVENSLGLQIKSI